MALTVITNILTHAIQQTRNGVRKMSKPKNPMKRNRFGTWARRFWPNLAGAVLAAYGVTTLAWVGQLTWIDVTVWGKDIALIFFGSRTGENISLGIGMKVIHYFLIGLALLLLGLVMLFRRWSKFPPKAADYTSGQPQKQKPLAKSTAKKEKDSSECPHHFGYLRSLPDDQAVLQECTTCQELLECRNPI